MARLVTLSVLMVLLLVPTVQAKNIWRLTDINPGAEGSGPSFLTVYDGDLYFRANDKPHLADIELWRYDIDTHTASLAADICPGTEGSWMEDLVVYNGGLYFRATDGTHGTQMWKWEAGAASPVTNFSLGSGFPAEMTAYGPYLIYRQGLATNQLQRYDGTTQAPIPASGGGNVRLPQGFCEYNGLLYFSAGTDVGGAELWRTNGTLAVQLTTIRPGNGGDPRNLCVYDGDLYFSATDGVSGNELWRYTSSTNTAELVADLVSGGEYASGNPNGMIVYDGKMYFNAWDADHGFELWSYDSATDDAQMVVEINPTPKPTNGDDWMMDSSPHGFVVYEDVLYFVANDGAHGDEIWSWDGTEAELEFDIYTGQYGSNVSGMMVVGDSVYLSADDGIHGSEIWQMQFPEPATLAMIGLGLFGILARRRRI